jgi:hypothetical protein
MIRPQSYARLSSAVGHYIDLTREPSSFIEVQRRYPLTQFYAQLIMEALAHVLHTEYTLIA